MLESIYSALPPLAQDVAISAWGAGQRIHRYGPSFHRSLAFLQESEHWSADQIARYQSDQLHRMIVACNSTPFYKEIFGRCGVSPNDIQSPRDLESLPLVTKGDVRARTTDFYARAPGGRVRYALTSGTTGTPLRIALTPDAYQFQWAVWWRHRARVGLRLGDRFLTFGARVPGLASETPRRPWRSNLAVRQAYLPVFKLTAQSVKYVVKWLNDQSFDFFAGYPSAMYVLARQILDSGMRLMRRPKWICCGSEALLPHMRAAICRAFGPGITEVYGMAECVGGFAQCEMGRLHLDFELGIAELLPIPGSLDTSLRRLVFTGLQNTAMPLLRYEVGDYVRVVEGACSCGRQSLAVESIEGRAEDYVRTPDGRLVFGLNQVFKVADHIREAQVVQRDVSSVEVRVVPADGFGPSDIAIMERELRRRVGSGLRIQFVTVERIERSATGKFRGVVSLIT